MHREGSSLNQANRLNWARRGEKQVREEEREEVKRGATDQETRGCVVKMAESYRKEKLGEGSETLGWRGLRGGQCSGGATGAE